MTGWGVWTSPFPKILLSSTDHGKLQELVQTILDANLKRYLNFTGVDLNSWKLIKGKDDMQVYSNRRDQRQWPLTVRVDDDRELQTLLCVGSSPGTLNEMMDGVSKSANGVKDLNINDSSSAAELVRIKAPNPLEPFAGVAIKWMELDVRRRSMGMVKNRDFVYIEATGIKNLPSGESLGYHIMHSVGIPGATILPGRVRSELSICTFFRQVNQSLFTHSLAILEPMSERVRQFVVPRFIKMLQSTFRPTSESSMEKVKSFARTLSQRHSEQNAQRLSGSDHYCVTCFKRRGRMHKLARRQNTCIVCSGSICSACKIEKKLKVPSVGAKVTTKKVIFCFSCLSDVTSSKGSQYSFSEDSDNDSESYPQIHHWAWTTKRPSWSTSKSSDPTVDFTCTT